MCVPAILKNAGGRSVSRNICKIAKFVDTADNEPNEGLLKVLLCYFML